MSYVEINKLRNEGNLLEAYKLASKDYELSLVNDGVCHDLNLLRAFFWVCVDMVKETKEDRNGTELAIMSTLRTVYREMDGTLQKEKDAYGWSLCRIIADSMENLGSLACRKMLAEYFSIGTECPSRLHSYVLSIASRMAMLFPDFQFVYFLKKWGLQNILPEDRDCYIDEKTGRHYPSLIEKVAKGYAYSFIFRSIDISNDVFYGDVETLLRPYLEQKGYGNVLPMMATKLSVCEVKGRKITIVYLVGCDGSEVSAEVHCLTRYKRMHRNDIVNTMFRVLLRENARSQKQVVEAAIPSNMTDCERSDRERFGYAVGYVDHIDILHGHIHIYDNNSRHFVAQGTCCNVSVGEFVEFIPIVPKDSGFKTAVITRMLSVANGPSAFGPRKVKVTYVDTVNGYCAWELVDSDHPIIEKGTQSPCYIKGYLSKQVIQARGLDIPNVGDVIRVVVYLKRGRDGVKRPWVAVYERDS